jgi:exodeoxyribonuclease V alpha subunit
MHSSPEEATDMKTLAVTTKHEEFGAYIDAKVLTTTEIHAAERITNSVFRDSKNAEFIDYLSVAMAVWAPANGHVCVNLGSIQDQVREEIGSSDGTIDLDLFNRIKWTNATEWLAHLSKSPLVSIPDQKHIDQVDYSKPLVLFGEMLYLTRQWVDEGVVSSALRSRLTAPPTPLPKDFTNWIKGIFENGPNDYQAEAVKKALTHNTSVLLGGPGTGKTYTIAGMLHAFYSEHATKNGNGSSQTKLRVALAAPTAKAARQVTASVEASLSSPDFPKTHQAEIKTVTIGSSTIHRLLGWLPGRRGRFAHQAQNLLPYDIVVIDEVSMVSLPLMARLLEALGPDTKLVLVGDPQQLKSVEAGAVLPEIASLHATQRYPITKLLINRRQGIDGIPNSVNNIGQLATNMSEANLSKENADEILKFIESNHPEITFIKLADENSDPSKSSSVLNKLEPHLLGYNQALGHAKQGNIQEALTSIASVRVLCGHREGPYGVSTWNNLIANSVGVPNTRGAIGQPLLNTRNDLRTGLVNGDSGIVVQTSNGKRVVFSTQEQEFEPSVLEDIEIAFATTIHKSQGSEYGTVIVVVPPVGSPLLRRELLYTAITRARKHLVLVGSEAAITTAVMSTINRASGLAARIGKQ